MYVSFELFFCSDVTITFLILAFSDGHIGLPYAKPSPSTIAVPVPVVVIVLVPVNLIGYIPNSSLALLMAASVMFSPLSMFAISVILCSLSSSAMWLVVASSPSTLYTL